MTIVQHIKLAKAFFAANPYGTLHVKTAMFPVQYSRDEWHDWFYRCLNDKIHRNEPIRGRKDSDDYYHSLRRIQQRLNNRGIVRMNELNFDRRVQSRLSHRLT